MIEVKGNPLSTDPEEYLTWKLEVIWGVHNIKAQKRTCKEDEHDYFFSGEFDQKHRVMISLGHSRDGFDRYQLYCDVAVFTSCVILEGTGGWRLRPYRNDSDKVRKARWKVKESYLHQRWQEYFRRSSYLSGTPIECTMHEQLEWKLWFEEQKQLALEAKTFAPSPQAVQLGMSVT